MEEEKKEIRTLLCCIGRKENQYIREFVEYNKMAGFTNICLFDNNYDGEDDFKEVIGDYIDEGYVILKDYRNRQVWTSMIGLHFLIVTNSLHSVHRRLQA